MPLCVSSTQVKPRAIGSQHGSRVRFQEQKLIRKAGVGKLLVLYYLYNWWRMWKISNVWQGGCDYSHNIILLSVGEAIYIQCLTISICSMFSTFCCSWDPWLSLSLAVRPYYYYHTVHWCTTCIKWTNIVTARSHRIYWTNITIESTSTSTAQQ